MGGRKSNGYRRTPSVASIPGTIRNERGQERIAAGNNDRTVGLRHGHTTQSRGTPGRLLRRSPSQPTVGGRVQKDDIAGEIVVPLCVAMSKERTGRIVVTGHPCFVTVLDVRSHIDRIVPREPAVGGTADSHCRMRRATGQDGQRGDQPDPVRGVKSHGRIADTIVRSGSFYLGQSRQRTVGPGYAAVNRSGPSVIRRTSTSLNT